ncbi:MAG: ABC transporter ATP-binding protein [Oscillospiraceae bacterium]|nr:ABC transporter ATP-binding protein [Oscillospiraceae bacterium]
MITSNQQSPENIVEMRSIRKVFPGIVANDDITMELRKGEIHALLGENGAGKSTLMSILFGLYQPDAGEIVIRGKKERISGPNAANALGIGMVHQHFKLVHNFTTTENIILGMESPFLDVKNAAKRVKEFSEMYGLNVDPHAKIEDISVGMQQRVEILKMLYRNAEVLIFDEPTAVLTPQETAELMKIMRTLIEQGKSIVLITHKLKEIKAVADRCTVIRRGKYIGTVNVESVTEETMAEMMVGRQISLKVDKEAREPGETVLSVKNLSVLNARKTLAVSDFSLDVHKGEIIGLAGVDGNGQTELVEALTGLRNVQNGSVFLNGKDITDDKTGKRIKSGMAHIPEDRQRRGLILDFTLEDNLVIERYRDEPFAKRGLLQRDAIRQNAEQIIENFDVRAGEGAKSIVRSMSGGNQQKAIVGREMELHPQLLLAVQPTRGLDVGSIEYIHKRLVQIRDAGYAVLLVSLELDEIMSLSDKIAVISHGKLVGLLDVDKTDENEIGLMMTGIGKGETA